jgi:tRNA isopentenyl-2-thiomethyl-A-37 hydroxylase MiaE
VKYKTLAFINTLLESEMETLSDYLKLAQESFDSNDKRSAERLERIEARWAAICDAKRDFDEQNFR